LADVTGTFSAAETVTGIISGSGTLSSTAATNLYTIWAHEMGTDKVVGDNQTAVQSYFETSDFGYPTGSVSEQQTGPDRWTRLFRVEPDFNQVGDMTMTVTGREFARAPLKSTLVPYTFTADQERIDLREQRREIRVKFESNVAGGDYEAGKVLLHIEPGDVRN
jgi:hypothetical protein